MTKYIEAANTYPDSPEYAQTMKLLSEFATLFSDKTLVQCRSAFNTEIQGTVIFDEPELSPPSDRFDTLTFQSAGRSLPAYVSCDPKDNKKHPAVIWISGGESNNLHQFWEVSPVESDETATQLRQSDIVVMFPSFRGGNQNSGYVEYNYGEVDDVIACAKLLASLPYVDEDNIYLVGHSAGGTMALLVSEIASQTEPDLFRSVICFGLAELFNTPGFELHTPLVQGTDDVPEVAKKELLLRAPYFWLNDIRIPTWLLEGVEGGNVLPLENYGKQTKEHPFVHTVPVLNHNHFTVLAPTLALLAKQILAGEAISLTSEEINQVRL